jgi:hypothetical protein
MCGRGRNCQQWAPPHTAVPCAHDQAVAGSLRRGVSPAGETVFAFYELKD